MDKYILNRWSLGDSLVGKRVLAAEVSPDRERVSFETDLGPVIWEVDGDCCSTSWIEAVDFELLVGGTVASVAEAELPEGWLEKYGSTVDGEESPGYGRIYGIEIRTERGLAIIDFRNDGGNGGYYGGSMCVVAVGDEAAKRLGGN